MSRSALHVIPQPAEGYTVSYLKEVVRQAEVYIRPLQRDLKLTPEMTMTSWVTYNEQKILLKLSNTPKRRKCEENMWISWKHGAGIKRSNDMEQVNGERWSRIKTCICGDNTWSK